MTLLSRRHLFLWRSLQLALAGLCYTYTLLFLYRLPLTHTVGRRIFDSQFTHFIKLNITPKTTLRTSLDFPLRENTNRELFRILQALNAPPYMPLVEALERYASVVNNSIIEQAIRSGFGLQEYTRDGESFWVENGVEYHRFPYKEPQENRYYNSEYEAYIPFNETTFFEGASADPEYSKGGRKIILWWQQKVAQLDFPGLALLRACPDFPCVVTSDRKYTNASSVMLVDVQFVQHEMPPPRHAHQIFVHYQMEAPSHNKFWWYHDLFQTSPAWNSAFNWTMSYRRDSDIPTHYGLIRKRLKPSEKNYTDILSAKTGQVAWLVSNCKSNSKREDYVRVLGSHVNVDVYGECGSFHCTREQDQLCFQKIRKKYKFYLAFESNLCPDYVTEKLFRFFDADFIIIARGEDCYSRILPPETFLNTARFNSPEELAETILYLDSHDDAYLAMLKEKDKYFSIYEDYPLPAVHPTYLEYRYEAVPMCRLCQMVWNLKKYSKTIPDMKAWFRRGDFRCHPPADVT